MPHTTKKGHKDAVSPHRKGGTKAALGGTGLFEPAQHVLNLGTLSMGGHPRAQTAHNFAQGAARPLNAMIALQHLKHLLLGVIGGPTAHTLGQSRRSQARFDAQTQF